MAYQNIENFNPKTCLFGKISRVNRVTNSIIRKHLAKHQITESQTSLLFVLSKKTVLSQKELGEFTKLEKSSINRNIKRLIENSFIEKQESRKLKITNKGLKKVSQIIPDWEKAMTEIKQMLSFDGEFAIDILHNKLV